MANNKGMGERITLLREKKGITKSELARGVGVTTTAVWNWEKNGLTPKMPVLIKIADYFGVPIPHLQTSMQAQAEVENILPQSISEIIEATRIRIAKVAGFKLDRVKLHLELTTD